MLQTALRLNLRQWRYLAESLVLLRHVDQRLRRNGFVQTREWIDRKIAADAKLPFDGDDIAFAQEVAMVVGIAGRRSLAAGSCLRQALALRYFLGRLHIDSDLRIGVRGGQRDFAAHAWVEKDGVVLIGGDQSPDGYVVLT